jgi:hypothetical protein
MFTCSAQAQAHVMVRLPPTGPPHVLEFTESMQLGGGGVQRGGQHVEPFCV